MLEGDLTKPEGYADPTIRADGNNLIVGNAGAADTYGAEAEVLEGDATTASAPIYSIIMLDIPMDAIPRSSPARGR